MKIGIKLIIIQVLLLLLIAATFLISFAYFVIPQSTESMNLKARQITKFMQETMKYETIEEQQKSVEKMITLAHDLSYILIVDQTGKAIVHSDPTRIGKVFDDSGTLSAARDAKTVEQEYLRDKDKPESPHHNERCIDIIMPYYDAHGVHVGAVNIGLSLKAVDEESNEYYWIMIISLFLLSLIVVAIWFYFHKYLVKPIVNISELAGKLSLGDTDFEVLTSQKDEIGDLYNAFASVRKNIDDIIEDINMLTETSIDGKLDFRISNTKYSGKYKDMLSGINKTMDSIIRPLNVAAEYIDRISKGDIPPKITDDYRGDFNEIKNNINQCIDAVNLLVHDSNKLFQATIDGDINQRADTIKHLGEFRSIIVGVNATLDRLVGLIDEMPVGVQIVDKQNKVLYKNRIVNNY